MGKCEKCHYFIASCLRYDMFNELIKTVRCSYQDKNNPPKNDEDLGFGFGIYDESNNVDMDPQYGNYYVGCENFMNRVTRQDLHNLVHKAQHLLERWSTDQGWINYSISQTARILEVNRETNDLQLSYNDQKFMITFSGAYHIARFTIYEHGYLVFIEFFREEQQTYLVTADINMTYTVGRKMRDEINGGNL